MGCTISPEQRNAINANRDIEKELKKGQEKEKLVIKILLLGAGESGKSTILKQMKIIHKQGYSPEEIEDFKIILNGNLVGFFEGLSGVYKTQSEFTMSDEEIACMNSLLTFAEKGVFSTVPAEIYDAMKTLWKNENFPKLITKSECSHLNIALKKLVEDLDRVSKPDFIPSQDDILLARVKTTGIKQLEFEYKETNFIICDVGGQRSERRKWVHAFEGVDAIIFFVAVSEYDQKLEEDETINRMHESMKLFESILNTPWFQNSSIILFLNKTDLLEEKIKYSDFKKYFSEFTGDPLNLQQVQEFIRGKFEALNKSTTGREIYTYFTNATQTTQMADVFEAVSDMIMKKNLRDYGLY